MKGGSKSKGEGGIRNVGPKISLYGFRVLEGKGLGKGIEKTLAPGAE